MIKQTILNELIKFHDVLESNSHEKRFAEKWLSDPSFRKAFRINPKQTLSQHHIKLDEHAIFLLNEGKSSWALERQEQIKRQKENWTHHFYSQICAPTDESWLTWRKRQVSRQVFDLGPQHALTNIHSSLTVELNKGCSVGCWFCALSPDKNTIPMLYESGGEARFSTLIHAMKEELGSAVKSGFLYWGSEPMDNPDYERYCLDFLAITGVFPPTTTAIPHKNPDRTRRFLKLAEQHNAWLTRFSVTSTSLMNRLHSLFTPEELATTECLYMNAESSLAFGVGGRYRDYLKKHPEILQEQKQRLKNAPFYEEIKEHLNDETHAHGSIACVTGFLVNLVDQSIALIAPTHADDEYPLGYITFSKENFSSNSEIASTIRTVVERGRILTLQNKDVCAFHSYIKWSQNKSDIIFQGRLGTKIRAKDLGKKLMLNSLCILLSHGNHSKQKIISSFPKEKEWIESVLHRLWLMGVLKEPRHAKTTP